MKRLRRAAVVSALTDGLRERGSWSGETHIQKTTYILQDLLGVPLELDYVLYKHGPYSFDLHDELAEMRADEILDVIPQPPPYGPKLVTGEGAEQLRERFPKTLKKYEPQITYVAERLGDQGVTSLEKLATALWVTKEEGGSVTARAKTLNALKPHISITAAERAVEQIDLMVNEAPVVAG